MSTTENSQRPRVILVHSFKGGTGKTLLSLNLAQELVRKGKRVLYIESDFSMPAFHTIFENYRPDVFLNDFLGSDIEDLSNFIYPDLERNFGVVFCDSQFRAHDKVHGTDQSWFINKKQQLSMALSKLNYDYVVFDTQPGVHLFIINIIALADEIFLLARPDKQSIRGTELLLERIYSKSIKIFSDKTISISIVFNQIPKIDEIQDIMNKFTASMETKFDFISRYFQVNYHEKTSYNIALEKFILPEDDPTRVQLKDFVGSVL